MNSDPRKCKKRLQMTLNNYKRLTLQGYIYIYIHTYINIYIYIHISCNRRQNIVPRLCAGIIPICIIDVRYALRCSVPDMEWACQLHERLASLVVLTGVSERPSIFHRLYYRSLIHFTILMPRRNIFLLIQFCSKLSKMQPNIMTKKLSMK